MKSKLPLNFSEYAMGVNDDLWVTQPDCANATRQAFKMIQDMTMTEAGRLKLNQQLQYATVYSQNG